MRKSSAPRAATFNVFAVDTLRYDPDLDVLVAEVHLARSCLDPDVELDAEESVETFCITADFLRRLFTIADRTDHAGDVEPHYPSSVMTAFLKEWRRHYAELDAASSVGSIEPFRFNVDL